MKKMHLSSSYPFYGPGLDLFDFDKPPIYAHQSDPAWHSDSIVFDMPIINEQDIWLC